MTELQAQHDGGLRRILSRELRYPVLIIERDRPLHICGQGETLTGQTGLFVDNDGFAYQIVDVDDPLVRDGKPVPRAERVRLVQQGLHNVPVYIHYKGEPVQLSVDVVRQKIAWLVSARGHFEIPQGLPDLSGTRSVAELIDILLKSGFR